MDAYYGIQMRADIIIHKWVWQIGGARIAYVFYDELILLQGRIHDFKAVIIPKFCFSSEKYNIIP